MSAIERNYTAWRSAPWGGAAGDVYFVIEGEDWRTHAFAWKFCPNEGASALFTLNAAAAGTQGVSVTWDTAYENEAGEVVGASTVVPQIDEATLEALTYSGTSPLVLFHMLYITPSGGAQSAERYGNLTIRQGAPD